MRRRYRILSLVFILALIISQTSCTSKSEVEPVVGENYYLDTICQISVYDMGGELDEEAANEAIDAGFKRCAELDKTLTNKNDSSEVAAINNAGSEWVEVSDDTVYVIEQGLRYSEMSGGRFDITIGRVTDLWDFHADEPVVPSEDEINEALEHVDYTKVEIDGNKVRLLDSEMKIDLGGIAKGYVCDQVADTLEEHGVTSAVINLGGNIVTIGRKSDESDFVIGIEKPFSDRSDIVGKSHGDNETFVTSGVYEREFEVDGKIYHHVLDAKTGYPVQTKLDSVTLVAPRGMSLDCDAMSTMTLIMGLEDGLKFIESMEAVEAVFCPTDGDIVTTSGMDFEAI